ncbi:MAG: DUF459 domain-containing protein [Myxococcales bacterium]|nr:DUF459 domain-containing protein [Myxococcales bacterium]
MMLAPRTARADRYGPKGGTRILVIGDSMIAGGLGLFLARALGNEHGYDVTRSGKSSSGLARPDFYDWPQQARSLVGDRPFDATVVMFGGNDAQGLRMRGGGWIRWPEDGWAEEYAQRVAALHAIVAPQQQHVFWVGMPVMRPTQLGERVKRINTIFRAEMAIRRHAWFIDIWALLADAHGRYADSIEIAPKGEGKPAKVRVRAGDGVHMTVAGAHYVAAHVQRVVHTTLSKAS